MKVNKWSVNNFPDEFQLSAPLDELPLGQVNRKSVSRKIGEVLGWFFGPLVMFSLADLAWLGRKERRKGQRGQKDRQETENEQH